MNSFIVSRIDYCNNVPFGVPRYQPNKVYCFLNVASRLIYGIIQDMTSPLTFLRTDCFGCVFLQMLSSCGQVAPWMSSIIHRTFVPRHRIRWASYGYIFLTFATNGSFRGPSLFYVRSFSVTGPAAWNALSRYFGDTSSAGIFKSRL